MRKSRANITIDLDAKGKHHGHICFAKSVDDSAWGQIRLPVTVIRNDSGSGSSKTLLLVAGNHGDEYEGMVAQFKLAQKLQKDDVRGCVIILPCLNFPAVAAGMRTSPLDGGNMNRAFDGDAGGNWTQQIAYFVTTELLPRADIVLDMHSGGKTLDFIPSAVMHRLEDEKQMRETAAALKAFAAPVSMVLEEDTSGMLDGAAEGRGKIFISTELGGRGSVVAERVAIAENGIHNVMAHFGIIDVPLQKSETPTRFLDTPAENFIRATRSGIYEPLADLGDTVAEGDPVGQIWDFHNLCTAPEIYPAPSDGVVYARHVPGLIAPGDCMALVAVASEMRE
ncbi:MAG: N-alpha-acetyl diaminobutyric acid deacetylase DoeB [Micavibrio sp.]|nr:MAG: N-alpha-acetyl diaminobutyric acid deacetylase DoeB [Micavibrio sp.]